MPADWPNFIKEFSEKLASQNVKNNQDLAELISDQYLKATVGKAQSPFGNTHERGNKEILVSAFKKGFDLLQTSPSPTFEEKEKDPNFSDLEQDIPLKPELSSDLEGEFLLWAKEEQNRAPNFSFFQILPVGQKFPSDLDGLVPALSERLVFQYDGSSEFKIWISTLRFGILPEIGKKVELEFKKMTSGLSDAEIKARRDKLNYSRKIFQIEYSPDQTLIPSYVTKQLITKFTYLGKSELALQSGTTLLRELTNSFVDDGSFKSKIAEKIKIYGNGESGELKKYSETLQKWSESLSQKAQIQIGDSNLQEPTDPYEIMSKGVVDYWKSTLQKPLSPNPPIAPCNVLAPGLGLYVPIYYGNQKKLADFLRRAWNSGKKFKTPVTISLASKVTSTALAFSFATHLLELKFLYRGGITTPSGPVPMVGFVPFVF